MRRLAVDFDPANVQMAGVQNDFLGLSIRHGLEAMNNVSSQLLLVKKNIEIGRDVGGHPVVIIAKGIGVPRGIDDSRRHASSLTLG